MQYNNVMSQQTTKIATEAHLQNQNLLSLVLFLLISIGAYAFRDFNLFAISSEPVRQLLGCPPPAYLINIALAVYCFSSATLTLTAMANDARPIQKWNHLGYRSAFFVFYSFSGAISTNFVAVLIVALSLYGLDQLHIWFYHFKESHQDGLLGKS